MLQDQPHQWRQSFNFIKDVGKLSRSLIFFQNLRNCIKWITFHNQNLIIITGIDFERFNNGKHLRLVRIFNSNWLGKENQYLALEIGRDPSTIRRSLPLPALSTLYLNNPFKDRQQLIELIEREYPYIIQAFKMCRCWEIQTPFSLEPIFQFSTTHPSKCVAEIFINRITQIVFGQVLNHDKYW